MTIGRHQSGRATASLLTWNVCKFPSLLAKHDQSALVWRSYVTIPSRTISRLHNLLERLQHMKQRRTAQRLQLSKHDGDKVLLVVGLSRRRNASAVDRLNEMCHNFEVSAAYSTPKGGQKGIGPTSGYTAHSIFTCKRRWIASHGTWSLFSFLF